MLTGAPKKTPRSEFLLYRNRKLFEGVIDVDHALKSQLIREFDERFIVPTFKYKDWIEYYNDASFHYKVNRVSVPTLTLNAVDDCFAPIECKCGLIPSGPSSNLGPQGGTQ